MEKKSVKKQREERFDSGAMGYFTKDGKPFNPFADEKKKTQKPIKQNKK